MAEALRAEGEARKAREREEITQEITADISIIFVITKLDMIRRKVYKTARNQRTLKC